jgi:hypothetical protein
VDRRTLLERHNPILVIFPQDPWRPRPDAWRRDGHGDYHPCSAEFFIDRSFRRTRPRSYDYWRMYKVFFLRFWEATAAHGIGTIRDQVATVSPEETEEWELDIAEIPSQHPDAAWAAHGEYLDGEPDRTPYRCVTYARYVDGESGRALQYWYLYIYNDFMLNHEGDWEMVTIELGPDDRPRTVAYANHIGGLRRSWALTPREGDRPILYVARGSHAGFFRYASGGHALGGTLGNVAPPFAFAFLRPLLGVAARLLRYLQRLPGARIYRDFVPADPARDTHAPREHAGVRLTDVAVSVLPDERDVTPDSEHWWLRYRGYWGSTHPRVIGAIGIRSPWVGSEKDHRWRDPIRWLRDCTEDAP